MNYYTFSLGGKEYKARLTVKGACDLEDKLGTNPINILLDANEGKLPRLKSLLTILHTSLQPLEHGISMDNVYEIYEEHLSKGGKFEDLINIIVGIFQSGGFLTNAKPETED